MKNFWIIWTVLFLYNLVVANDCETLRQRVQIVGEECAQYKNSGKNVQYKKCLVRQNRLQRDMKAVCAQASQLKNITDTTTTVKLSDASDTLDVSKELKTTDSSLTDSSIAPLPELITEIINQKKTSSR